MFELYSHFHMCTGEGSSKTEKLALMFEQWASAHEDWKQSELVLRMKHTTSHKKRGTRRWLTEAQICERL